MQLKTALLNAETMAMLEIGDEYYSIEHPDVTIVIQAIDRSQQKITLLNNLSRMTTIGPLRFRKCYIKKGTAMPPKTRGASSGKKRGRPAGIKGRSPKVRIVNVTLHAGMIHDTDAERKETIDYLKKIKIFNPTMSSIEIQRLHNLYWSMKDGIKL